MNGKQLKNSILQWAIQGKLVPQDPNDEPASVLLDKIRQEKERLIKEKKIKRDKNASIIYRGEDNSYYEKILATGEVKCIDEEVPFEIPTSWSWARLLNVSIYIQRGKSPKYSPIKKYPVVAQKCNQWAGFSIDKAQFLEPESLSKYAIERILQDEDLMWNSTGLGTLGRMAVYYAKLNPYELAVADSHVTVIRLFKPFVSPLFFYFYFVSPTVQSVIEDKSDGSTKQKELSTTTVCNYLVPIPPRNEQTRIISKVTSLLPVIEKYGTQQEKLENLNRTINEQIKKSVLQEAIQGKLVPQIAEEGTAQKLLEQIKAEKQKLVKEGKLKKSALNDSVIFRGDDNKYYTINKKERISVDDEIPFDIPNTWEWCRLGTLFSHCTGKALNSSNLKGQLMTYITTSNLYWDRFELSNIKQMRFTDEEIEKCTATFGDLLVCEGGDIGRAAIWNYSYDIRIQNHIHKLRAYKQLCTKFFFWVFYFYKATGRIGGKGIGIQGLSSKALDNILIPLPPLKEQQRIVAQIEKLFEQLH
ncbi:restriction endonuclease subunit S [Prevotella copri]|uniref:restriction endonuclease subunit S n=1 Tax=Segatella copri TaxID=165179 RepID=UPI001C383047|nr:restriction endonuclease subunit S [Segatella copri]MBV3443265.1 restriction endonuclease subunit S [Segatella copri]